MNNEFQKDNFAEHNEIEIIKISKGRSRVKLTIRDKHLNGNGVLHGGAIFTLADTAFAIASNSPGISALGISVSISYFQKISKGIVFAEAEEISISNRLGTYLVRVWDEKETLIALFQGTVYRKKY